MMDYRDDYCVTNKPPLGLKPFWVHRTERLQDILGAIARYTESNMHIPMEWIEELSSLVQDMDNELYRLRDSKR